jgi:hypothetical protein
MKVINFENNPIHKNIILDACGSQAQPFDSVQIMRYIAENEIQGQTFDHHDIGFYLDELRTNGILREVPGGYFTKYELNK